MKMLTSTPSISFVCFLGNWNYHKVPKFSDTRNFAAIILKHEKRGLMHPNDADSIANSEEPDQTSPLGAV